MGFEGALIFPGGHRDFYQSCGSAPASPSPTISGNRFVAAPGSEPGQPGLGGWFGICWQENQFHYSGADGRHILTDVFTSAGVLVGLFLVWLTGQIWLDGATAALVGVNILYTGWKLVSHAFAGLMDASDVELLEEISTVLKGHRKSAWIDIHQLRARRAGERLYVDFHLILPQDFSLEEGHREVKELEQIFQDPLPGSG